MKLDNLSDAWGRLGDGGGDAAARVADGGLRLELQVRVRDGLETVVALLLLPVFAWLAYATPHALSSVGAAIIALYCVLIPVRFRSARRAAVDPSRPLAEAVRLERDRVRAQRELMGRIVWWYAGPLWLGVSLFVVGPLPLVPAVLAVLGTTAFMAWIVRVNHTVVTLVLDPWDAELEEIVRDLDATEAAAPGGEGAS